MLRGRIRRMKRKVKQDDERITSDLYTACGGVWRIGRSSVGNG